MKNFIYICIVLLCCLGQAHAELIVSGIQATGNVQSQSIAVLTDHDFVFYPAQLEKTKDGMSVSAQVPALSTDTLVAAVVVLSDGNVISSALHKAGAGDLNLESTALVKDEIGKLKSQISEQKNRLNNLQSEIDAVNSRLRKEAGLEEVDAIYNRVKILDEQIQALKRQ